MSSGIEKVSMTSDQVKSYHPGENDGNLILRLQFLYLMAPFRQECDLVIKFSIIWYSKIESMP